MKKKIKIKDILSLRIGLIILFLVLSIFYFFFTPSNNGEGLKRLEGTNLFFDNSIVSIEEIFISDFMDMKKTGVLAEEAEGKFSKNKFNYIKKNFLYPPNTLKTENDEYLLSPYVPNYSYKIFDYAVILKNESEWSYEGDTFYFDLSENKIKKISDADTYTNNTTVNTYGDFAILSYSDKQNSTRFSFTSYNKEDVLALFTKDGRYIKIGKYVRSSHYDASLADFFWNENVFYFKINYKNSNRYFSLKIIKPNFESKDLFYKYFIENTMDRKITDKNYDDRLKICEQINTFADVSSRNEVSKGLQSECKINFAIIQRGESVCESQNDSYLKDKCYFNVAFTKKDTKICEKISKNTYTYITPEICKLIILENKTIDDPNLCNQFKTEDVVNVCFINSAIINKDRKICDLIVNKNFYYRDCLESFNF